MTESKRIFQLVDKKYHWKLTTLNNEFSICATYPARHYVPPYYDDTALKQVAAFRDGNRFPAFSWIHPHTLAAIVRCSQPLPGRLGGKRCPEDEQLIAQVFKCNPESPDFGGYILDARPYASAMANRAMGAGFERSEHYGGLRVEFLGIDNIHTVSDSLAKLKRAVRAALPGPFGSQGVLGSGVGGGFEVNGWLEKLSDSGWLKHLQTVLNGAILAATLVHNKKTSVIVHCTHGWDRTAELTSLPMLMLDPYYRTLVGFQVLIEKEWVAYGHKFLDRCNHTGSQQLAKEESPIFLQFLDCVHQLLLQFPTHFEFNERFLIDLVDVVYSCQYGTFLANNPLQHAKLDTARKTVSAWSYFNHSTIRPLYLNPLYDSEAPEAKKENNIFLRPSTAGNKLVFWDALFARSDNDPGAETIFLNKCTELQGVIDKQAAEIAELKARLSALGADVDTAPNASSSTANNISDNNGTLAPSTPQQSTKTSRTSSTLLPAAPSSPAPSPITPPATSTATTSTDSTSTSTPVTTVSEDYASDPLGGVESPDDLTTPPISSDSSSSAVL